MNKEIRTKTSLTTAKNAEMNKAILDLAARFGYISVREVEYLFGCNNMVAVHRLYYLTKILKLLTKFESLVHPEHFYCLSSYGKEMSFKLDLSDEIRDFAPSDYRSFWNIHHRQLTKCFISFRKIFGVRFAGWVSERQLSKEHVRNRVVDGEFYLAKEGGQGNSPDLLKCWVELELSLKSPARYRWQFSNLSSQVCGLFNRVQIVHRIYFLSGSPGITKRLMEHAARQDWGECEVYFAGAGEFLENPDEGRFMRMPRREPLRQSMLAEAMSA